MDVLGCSALPASSAAPPCLLTSPDHQQRRQRWQRRKREERITRERRSFVVRPEEGGRSEDSFHRPKQLQHRDRRQGEFWAVPSSCTTWHFRLYYQCCKLQVQSPGAWHAGHLFIAIKLRLTEQQQRAASILAIPAARPPPPSTTTRDDPRRYHPPV